MGPNNRKKKEKTKNLEKNKTARYGYDMTPHDTTPHKRPNPEGRGGGVSPASHARQLTIIIGCGPRHDAPIKPTMFG